LKLVVLRVLLLFCILLFCPSALLMAQDKAPLFEPLPHNLHNNSVRCILRDSKGYMWFGTSDGLARYDGVNFYVYENDPDDQHSIDHNSINAMVEDDNIGRSKFV
jgi:ligand-binding sensor domain-containing protein